MIIPGNASLAIVSSPQEPQGTREEEGDFGALLTEIEHHAASLSDQGEEEQRALESVLQALMSLFQSCTPANLLPAAATPVTEEPGLMSVRPAGGLPLGLLPGMVLDGAHNIGYLTFPATDSQSPGPSPTSAEAPESVSLLLNRQESIQNLSGLFMNELATRSSATLPNTMPASSGDRVLATAEAPFLSETPLQPLSPLSAQTPVGNQDGWDGLAGSVAPSILSQGERQHEGIRQSADAETPGNRVLPHTVLATSGEGHRLISETTLQAQRLFVPSAGESHPLSAPTLAAGEMQQPGTSWSPEGIFQGTSVTSQPSPLNTMPAALWAGQGAEPPLAEAHMSLPTAAQAEAAAESDALQTMVLTQEEGALSERDASPSSRRMPESQEHASEALPSLPHLAADQTFSSSLTRATSHTPSADSATGVPPSHALEDVARQWPRPLPSNMVLLHLEPRELGALLLQVRVHDKRLIASFQAQSPEAEALLRSHLPSLQASLSQHGFEVQPIAITLATEGFNANLGAGTGTFAHQHSAFQAFAQDQQTTGTGETQSEVDLNKTARWPTEQRPRLLDVVI